MRNQISALLYRNFEGNGGRLTHKLVKTLHRMYGMEATRHHFPSLISAMNVYPVMVNPDSMLAFCIPAYHGDLRRDDIMGLRAGRIYVDAADGVYCIRDMGTPVSGAMDPPRFPQNIALALHDRLAEQEVDIYAAGYVNSLLNLPASPQ